MARRNPPPANPLWKKNSQASRIFEVLVMRYPRRTQMPDLARIAMGGLGRRMDNIRKYLQTIGWDYDNDKHWSHAREAWHSEYWLIYTGIKLTD